MTLPSTGGTAVLDRPLNHPEFQTGNARVAHIIARSGDKTGAALVTESRVFGTELEALCGHRMTAQHSTKGLPVCDPCKAIWQERFGDDSDGPDNHA